VIGHRPSVTYGVLALLVAGPLLAPGLVLAVDLSVVPHPSLPGVYWGIPSGTHSGPVDRLPIDLLFAAAGHIGAVAVLEKLLLLGSIFLAGLGMHRLAPTEDSVGRYFAGLLYAVNPFVYDRLYTGQWYLVLGYALLPWAFRAFLPLARGEWRRAWRFALLAMLVGVASPHMLALLVLLAFLSAGAELVRHRRPATVGAAALGLGLTVLGSLYWLLPRAGVEDLWRHVTPAQLALYQTVSDHTWGLLVNVAGLYGYWNDAAPIKAHLASWPLLALALAALAGLGLAARRRDTVAWAVAIGAGAGFVLALGGRGPLTGSLFTDLLGHVAAARSFREPQKGVALLVFGYAYLGAPAVAALRRSGSHARRLPAIGLAAALIVLPLLYGYRELGGLWGSMSTSSYPASWTDARSVLQREASSSNTLFLPWHGYLALSFAHGRVVGNPAPSFFGTPVLASRSVGEGAAAADNSDPRDAAVAALLARGSQLHSLGACLATLGVSHVLVADQADAARYSFLAQQSDLVVERRWSDLVLYRNTRPTGLVLAQTGSAHGVCGTHVRPVAATVDSPAGIRLARPLPKGETVLLAESFRPDWTLGELHAEPGPGGISRFVSDGRSTGISLGAWHHDLRAYLIGLVALILVALSAPLAGRRRRRRRAAALDPRASRSRVVVVLPTYNEAENLPRMVEALLAVFDRSHLNGSVLVVDDASPDGTGDLADEFARRDPRVAVVHRTAKEGLGPAYAAGFRRALEHGADLVVQMDCDFSHDPDDVPRLVAAADGADLVLGSRYARGGGVRDWGLGRRLLSRAGCTYAQVVLGLGYRDLTGGFKCYRRATLAQLDIDSLRASGYGFQIETTARTHAAGLAVHEVPIVFRDRTAGSSKMSARIALEALLLVPRLRLTGRRPEPPATPRPTGDGQAATAPF
jgi:dolichol-phosphate mannosyltransferase